MTIASTQEHAWSVHGGGRHVQGEAGDSLGHGACPAGSCWSAYDLMGRIGKGGFGTIHRARSKATGEVVAIKEIPRSAIAERELHVHRAAAASTGVVVRIPDFFVEPAAVFLVLELCRGPDLAHILETRGCVSEPEAQNVMRQLCRAIDHLHRRRIVHRDIKPGNIVLKESQPSSRSPIDRATIKLIDMGLSRVLPVASRPTGRIGAQEAAEWDGPLPSLGEETTNLLISGGRLTVGLRGRMLADRDAIFKKETQAGAGVPDSGMNGRRGSGHAGVEAAHAGGVRPPRVRNAPEAGGAAGDPALVAMAEARAAAALAAVMDGEQAHVSNVLAELEISRDHIDVRASPTMAAGPLHQILRPGSVARASHTSPSGPPLPPTPRGSGTAPSPLAHVERSLAPPSFPTPHADLPHSLLSQSPITEHVTSLRLRLPPAPMSRCRHPSRSPGPTRSQVSVCGSRIYAAPELLTQAGHADRPTIRLVAADALALDSFSLGLTLRHMLTGVPPGMSVLSYANGEGLLLPLLAGAAMAVQRIWRGVRSACALGRRRSVKRSVPAQDGIIIAVPAGAGAARSATADGQPAGATDKRLPDRRCGACVREYRYVEQVSKPARSLIASLSKRDPRQRLSAAEARRHEWMVGALLPPASGMPARALSVPEGLCLLGRARAAVTGRPQDADGTAGTAGCEQVATPAGIDLLPQHDADCRGGARSGARSGSADRRRVGTGVPAFCRHAPLPSVPASYALEEIQVGAPREAA